MPQFFIALAALVVGGALGWALKEVEEDNNRPTSADEKNFREFKEFMDKCKENEAEENWAKTRKP
jgi:hypothetical protein